jgi:hypothetical protein
MDIFLLIAYCLLCYLLAFGAAALTITVHFGMGAPSMALDYIEGNLLSGFGKMVLKKYAAFSKKYPRSLNPWKAFICVFCLGQWVGLFSFSVFALLWQIPFELVVIHNAILHVCLAILPKP